MKAKIVGVDKSGPEPRYSVDVAGQIRHGLTAAAFRLQAPRGTAAGRLAMDAGAKAIADARAEAAAALDSTAAALRRDAADQIAAARSEIQAATAQHQRHIDTLTGLIAQSVGREERAARQHAQERAVWAQERAELKATLDRLAAQTSAAMASSAEAVKGMSSTTSAALGSLEAAIRAPVSAVLPSGKSVTVRRDTGAA